MFSVSDRRWCHRAMCVITDLNRISDLHGHNISNTFRGRCIGARTTVDGNGCVIYHHRTRCRGAEGVHIRGVKTALGALGFTVRDISVVQDAGEDPKTQSSRQNPLKWVTDFVADRLPNELFKMMELVYGVRALGSFLREYLEIRQKGEQVAFIYERYAYFGYGLFMAARFFKIPVILEVNTTCLDYDVREIMFRRTAKSIEKYCLLRATIVVVVSAYLKERITAGHGIAADKILITPNAVSPPEFQLPPGGGGLRDSSYRTLKQFRSGGKIIIGFVGVFVRWHGLDFLLEACEPLLKSGQVVVALIGDGPETERILNLVKTKLLETHVIFVGRVQHRQIKYYIDLFDIAVMPDSNPFGSPMKIFEYMIMGKPVLAPDYGPITEVIRDGENGMIFERRCQKSFREKLMQLFQSKTLRMRIGRSARRTVLDRHTWDINVANVLRAFKQAV